MKIIHIIYSFTTGGSEAMLVDIVNEQIKTEDVTLIIINDYKSCELIDNIDKRVEVICLNRKPASKSLLPFIKLNWILLRKKPDAIHVHNESICGVILPRISRVLFLTVHALRVSLKHVRRAKCIFAISDAVKHDILKNGDYNVTVIPNGINIESIEKREKNDINPTDTIRIVQVARLESHKKGQDILIEAVSILKKRGVNNIMVDFIGSGSSENKLRELSKDYGVENHINFLGLQNRTYIYKHLKDYDIMCHPARYEGFGLTVAEGIAAKIPVLVSNEGGPFEIIDKGEYGYHFKMGNATDCADKIQYIINNYRVALNKTEKALEHVRENYSIERMVKDYITAYKNYI